MEKKLTLLTVAACLLLAACGTQHRYAYLADAPRNEEMPAEGGYASAIRPGDRLYIHVYSQVPESVRPFNEETNRTVTLGNQAINPAEGNSLRGFLVSAQGDINYPVVGRIAAQGLTCEQLARDIEARLTSGLLVTDPIVTVTLMNFHITVVGEVAQPAEVPVNGQRITILEAIALCGDVTMSGLRDCVVVLRPDGNEMTVDTVDLTSKSLLDSPYYYLRQGDIVYVTPTKKRKREAYRNEDWPKYITTGVAALRMAYLLVYRYTINTDWMRR